MRDNFVAAREGPRAVFFEPDLNEANSHMGRGRDDVITSYAFIFRSITRLSPSQVVVNLEGCQSRIVAVPNRAAAARVASALRKSGVQLIEFCDQCRPLSISRG